MIGLSLFIRYPDIIRMRMIVKKSLAANKEDSLLIGEIVIPQSVLYKIYIGERVVIKFDAFPSEQNGIVIGKINWLSTEYKRDGVLAIINMNIKQNATSFERKIKPGMLANAEIITQDLSICQRMYRNILEK
jgi:hypothetical protein